MPAIAWPSDFPSGWPIQTAPIDEPPAGVDHRDLYGWSVVDFDVPTAGAARIRCEAGMPGREQHKAVEGH